MIEQYLGLHISELLGNAPFNQWKFRRSVNMDIDRPYIDYEFPPMTIDVVCDLDGRIRSIFIYTDAVEGVKLTDIPFSSTRNRVRELFGLPSKYSEKSVGPLGSAGAWERYTFDSYTIHIEYENDCDEIKRITFMRNDIVPVIP